MNKTIKQAENETSNVWLNKAKWGLAFALLMTAVVANRVYATVPVAQRLIAWIFVLLTALLLCAWTEQGKQLVSFSREAWAELQRVFWPTKQETVQTTLIVIAMVMVVSLMIWGIDTILLVVIGTLTGQRG